MKDAHRRAVRILGWLLATCCCALLLFTMKSRAATVCLFRIVAGIPCPLCGLTRACLALPHGDWPEVFRLHPLAPLVMVECAGVWLVAGIWAFGGRLPVAQPRLERLTEKVILANAALFILVWGLRLYLHALPS